MGSETRLKGFSNIGDDTLTSIIKTNLTTFLDWGFLNLGAYFNINIPTSGFYGGDRHRLRPSNNPNYNEGQIWEGNRSNWVWESGISQSVQPIQVSGVYVNNVFYPLSTTGAYSHTIDYPNGRVIFDSGISTSDIVHVEHSEKFINVTDARNVPWFREIQLNSFRVDNPHFLQSASGDWSRMPETRLQLPAVLIEVTPRRSYIPYELGTGARYAYTDVLFHVLAEDDSMVGKLCDIISDQKEKTIFLFDTNLMSQQNRYPLDYNGSIASGALTYPDLVAPTGDGGFRWKKLTFTDSDFSNGKWISSDIYLGTVRMTTEVV